MTTQTSITSSPTRSLTHLLVLLVAALALALSIAPAADAQTRTTSDTKKSAAVEGCPDGWIPASVPGGCMPGSETTEDRDDGATSRCPDGFELGPAGCQAANLTAEIPTIAEFGCPDRWVLGPQGCQPGYLTIEVATFKPVDRCPDRWVPASVPGGCLPGYLTLRTVGLDGIDGCPDLWVPSSAPGGCAPGFFTSEPTPGVLEAQHHCAFGPACDPMIDAVIALGGSCVDTIFGTTCEIPTGPPTRD
jgi:hypothetical protein